MEGKYPGEADVDFSDRRNGPTETVGCGFNPGVSPLLPSFTRVAILRDVKARDLQKEASHPGSSPILVFVAFTASFEALCRLIVSIAASGALWRSLPCSPLLEPSVELFGSRFGALWRIFSSGAPMLLLLCCFHACSFCSGGIMCANFFSGGSLHLMLCFRPSGVSRRLVLHACSCS